MKTISRSAFGILWLSFCLIFSPQIWANSEPVEHPTFSRDIAPIVYQNCVSCHRPNQAAPFSLITYEDVARRARLSSRLIKKGYMPPWKPVAGHGDFLDKKRLTETEIQLFSDWVAAGKPEGNPEDLPKLPHFPEGWKLGEPDLIVKMNRSYTIPADGPDIYRNFVIPTGLEETSWIRAVEVRPTSPTVVHHVLLFADQNGLASALDNREPEPGFSQMIPPSQLIGGYVPGAPPTHWPAGLSLPLPAKSPLVLQAHFHPTGKPETEQFEVGIYFADKPSERSIIALQMPEMFGVGSGLKIAAGEKSYISHEVTLPVDCEAISVGGHAHYLGKEVKLTATFPDGSVHSLFYIDDWDLDWQGSYTYRSPVELPKGTVLNTLITYENTAENTNNPFYPPRDVRWGKESTDEMGSTTLIVIPKNEADAPQLKKLVQTEKKRAVVGVFRDGYVSGPDGLKFPDAETILNNFDKDFSGNLSIDEFPILSQKERFAKMDRNGDNHLDKKELKSLARTISLGMRFGMTDSPARNWLIKRFVTKSSAEKD